MIVLNGIAFDVPEEEKEKVEAILQRHKELCLAIKNKKQSEHLIEKRQYELSKQINLIRDEIRKLEKEQITLETIIALKAQAKIVVGNRIESILKKIEGLTEEEKVNYLLNHERDFTIFTEFNFDTFIPRKKLRKDGDEISESIETIEKIEVDEI